MKQLIRVFLLFGFYFTSVLYAPPKELPRIPSADKPGTPVELVDGEDGELQRLNLERDASIAVLYVLDLNDVAERLSAYLASPVAREQSVAPMMEVATVEALDMLPGSPRQLRGEDSDLQGDAEGREFRGGAASSSSGHKKEAKK